MVISTYFTVTTRISAQKMRESTPITCSGSIGKGWAPMKLSRNA
jgi:hypothetical protein